ncbi:hypothetical protein SARC_07060 [Sphaeroforma arctica JP610]|uniref:Fatty acid 2-hydroxylase n=1 Tax=Sphaeroforma arctica JP610 TaxID=667725 RepID=A0A0L0FVL6_9EUKA|nr:hypothetical protein SARC_07060 [Sphaeroforma arctica JP610]KNC80576.1 hypothetical protein SARC_07060 [Sphaeroforma arctica JP610]|eukprot:XP_014154478.1 hypothetical protein SARC_07060 [Sphaeroforma arctica JP610]
MAVTETTKLSSDPPPAQKQADSYTYEEVSVHHTADDCWVIHNGSVYDVTEFLEAHPGGPDIVLMSGGKDITKIMKDPHEHEHSDFAVSMLEDYKVGALNMSHGDSDIHESDAGLGVADPDFLDITKPLWLQMWNNTFEKDYYMQQVHIARHIKDGSPAPIFGGVLENLTMTPWYMVPLIWIPVSMYMYSLALPTFGPAAMLPLYLLGIFVWTLFEYSFHRFLFHIDYWLPNHPKALAIHFIAHGIHHFLPMDKLRLVMPPTLFTILIVPVLSFFFLLRLPESLIWAIASGAVSGYVGYDMVHYFLHHGRPPTEYLRMMKTYHLNHHYKNWDLGFGITTKFWDQVFGTELFDNKAEKERVAAELALAASRSDSKKAQ